MPREWSQQRVLVTGGASFIGANLVRRLVDLTGTKVRIADDFSSGVMSNIEPLLSTGAIELIQGDLRDHEIAARAVEGMDVCFHLAADHGGRGYIDLHQYACSTNLELDARVFHAALDAGVEKIIFASSGCIYPLQMQGDPDETLYLTEEMAGPPFEPDGLYGMAKLAGELTLRALHEEYGLKTASCRFFTAYGPLGVENHAVMAMIARAFVREDPFRVWGTGEQIRNWTYVDDIVDGTLLAAERIEDGSAVNLGTMERIRVLDAVHMLLAYVEYEPAIELQPEMPTGPYNRVADNSLAREILGWEPQVSFAEGLQRTVDWYSATKNADEVRVTLDEMLTTRGPVTPSSGGARAGRAQALVGQQSRAFRSTAPLQGEG